MNIEVNGAEQIDKNVMLLSVLYQIYKQYDQLYNIENNGEIKQNTAQNI